jgi:predicted DNA-binding transcriptional regulator AlpA
MSDHLLVEIARHRILNTAEAAAFLNFSTVHFRRLYRRGAVPPPVQLSTRKLGWRTGDLIDWVASRQSRPVTA